MNSNTNSTTKLICGSFWFVCCDDMEGIAKYCGLLKASNNRSIINFKIKTQFATIFKLNLQN